MSEFSAGDRVRIVGAKHGQDYRVALIGRTGVVQLKWGRSPLAVILDAPIGDEVGDGILSGRGGSVWTFALEDIAPWSGLEVMLDMI